MRVLCVGNKELVAFIRLFLESKGFRVNIVTDGQKALELIYSEHEQLDLLILDERTPTINGIELYNKVKSDVALRHLPTIFIATKWAFNRHPWSSSTDVVRMPIDVDELLDAIKSVTRTEP